MITVDELRSRATKRPKFSGVGAIKLITEGGEYRFYNEKLIPRLISEIHTHSYGFHSTILKGTLRHVFYDIVEVEEETKFELTQGVCRKGCIPEVIAENVTPIETLRTDMVAGTDYKIQSETFHEVEFVTENLVTLIQPFCRGPEPKFVRDKDIGYVCPWGDVHISEQDCWEIIDQILSN